MLDPEAEAYANVGASISLFNLAVGTATNVGAPTSPPDLEAVSTANVGATLGLGQTTRHTQSSKSSIGIERAFGDEPAPVTHGFPLPPSLTHTISILPVSEDLELPGATPKSTSDPSLAPNVGPASTCSSIGGLPLLAVGREMTHPSWSLAERIPEMYTIPATDEVYEQWSLLWLSRGTVLVSDDSVRSQASQGSEETLSPNQNGTFFIRGCKQATRFQHRASYATTFGQIFSKFRSG